MRCKPGDLAVVLRSNSGKNVGRLVEVLQFFGVAEFKSGEIYPDCWLVRATGARLDTYSGAQRCEYSASLGADGCFPDIHLRPIRPGSGDDESLGWKCGRPKDSHTKSVMKAVVIKHQKQVASMDAKAEFDAACDRWVMGVES